MKDKNYIIILIDAEKAFDKIHLLLLKTLSISDIKGIFPQHNKGHIKQAQS